MVDKEPGEGQVAELVNHNPAMLLGQADDWWLSRGVQEEPQEDARVGSGIVLK